MAKTATAEATTMKRNHSKLWVAIVVLFLIQAGLQARIFPMWARDYAPKQTAPVGLSPDQLLAAVAGFREFLAAILWVRADSFFDSGNYDAVLPMLRLVTWLDPHNLDVYSTGAWHMGYNFTDESQRSDRRFIPMALKFLEEGVQNNPAVWDLYFEMGWMYYHKIQDPVNAAPWMQIANEYPNMIPARRHMLAHTFFKAGRFDDCLRPLGETPSWKPRKIGTKIGNRASSTMYAKTTWRTLSWTYCAATDRTLRPSRR
jgi:hypothetical protein